MTRHRKKIKPPSMSKKASRDKLFPFRRECKTLFQFGFNYIERTNFEPPSSTLRRLYYRHENGIEDRFRSNISDPGSSERHFLRTRAWQCYKRCDFSLDFEPTKIIPTGSFKRRPTRHGKYCKQPFLEKLEFAPHPTALIDRNASQTPKIDSEQNESASFLSNTNYQYLVSGGHSETTQSVLHNSCFFGDVAGDQGDWNMENKVPNCR